MADYGFKAQNADGYIQIDDYNPLYVEMDTGTQATALFNYGDDSCWDWTRREARITFSRAMYDMPIIAVSPPTGEGAALLSTEKDSYGRFTGASIVTTCAVSYLAYKVYTPQNTVSLGPNGWGMRILDGSGGETFHSDKRYMRLDKLIVTSSGSWGPFVHTEFTNPFYALGGFGGSGYDSNRDYSNTFDLLGLYRKDNNECSLGVIHADGASGPISCLMVEWEEWPQHSVPVIDPGDWNSDASSTDQNQCDDDGGGTIA